MWAPGTLVRCVDNAGAPELQRSGVYTIASVVYRGTGVTLQEVIIPPPWVGYWHTRFRPVSEAHRKIVRDLLAPVPPVEEEIARVVREEVGAS